ncbi:Mitochondrial import inner membrane translocase subunit tim23 [Serendipita sp. 398]|nr:Mitochondrial import inner membrane translocase subunit tim23 [Serendipita sp. 398]
MSLFGFLQDKQVKEESAPQTSASTISGVTFSKPENVPVKEVVTATDVLAGAYDPSKLHPLAAIGDSLDYLLLDDDKINALPGAATALPSRGWSDDLCYGTGTTYLAATLMAFFIDFHLVSMCTSMRIGPSGFGSLQLGLGLGGLWGLREGAARPLAVSSARLRLNSVLNGVTRRGTFLGNSAGVLG